MLRVSTIEEAREQARKALSEDGLFNREQSTIVRALLDATEPPSEDMGPAASCHLCVGAGGYEDYDGGWVGCSCQRTREPMRDADGDMISSGEHRKISMSGDSFFVCDTCTNVLGLNVRWDHASKREDHQAAVESPPDKPAEDEREALIATRKLVHEVLEQSRTLPLDVQSAQVMLVLLDAGYSKGPRPITDEMVERAISAHRFTNAFGPEEVTRMRAALEAAEEARR